MSSKLLVDNSVVLLCDLQEKFRKNIMLFSEIVTNTNKVLSAAKHLEIPIIVTEQYPKGLGKTVPELDIKDLNVFDKTQFSMCIDPVINYLKSHANLKNIILCGIETHACIQQTAFDLMNLYNILIVSDATSSRSLLDRNVALKLLAMNGVSITTSESIILSLVRDASHPKFKLIQSLITNSSHNCDLLY